MSLAELLRLLGNAERKLLEMWPPLAAEGQYLCLHILEDGSGHISLTRDSGRLIDFEDPDSLYDILHALAETGNLPTD